MAVTDPDTQPIDGSPRIPEDRAGSREGVRGLGVDGDT